MSTILTAAIVVSPAVVGPAQAATYVVPPPSVQVTNVNRSVAAVYAQYAAQLSSISKAQASYKKYYASTAKVLGNQATIAKHQGAITDARARKAIWAAVLVGVKSPTTFALPAAAPMSKEINALAKKSLKAKKAAIKSAVKKQNSRIAKSKKTIAKTKKTLKINVKKQRKDAAKLAQAQINLDAAKALAPGAWDQFTSALNQLNSYTGPSALNPSVPRGVVQAINPGPECVPGQQIGLETAWECGTVTSVSDGDTAIVKTTLGESLTVRLTGIQATEVAHLPIPAQCFAAEAKARLKELLMPGGVGAKVQLRALYQESVNTNAGATKGNGGIPRPYRSIFIYDQNTGGYTYDVQKDLALRGLVLWFPVNQVPTGRETYHNGEYLDDINIAAASRIGIWAPQACGTPVIAGLDPQVNITPVISVKWDNNNEYVAVKNPSTTQSLNLSRWKLRNKNLDFFSFPDGSVLPPSAIGRIYTSAIPANNTHPYVWSWGKESGYNLYNNPSKLTCNESMYNTSALKSSCLTYQKDWLMGTGVFLMDFQGGTNPVNGRVLGGNLRAWTNVPCSYTYSANTFDSAAHNSCNPELALPAPPTLPSVTGQDLITATATLSNPAAWSFAPGMTIVTTGSGEAGAVVTGATVRFTGFGLNTVTLTMG